MTKIKEFHSLDYLCVYTSEKLSYFYFSGIFSKILFKFLNKNSVSYPKDLFLYFFNLTFNELQSFRPTKSTTASMKCRFTKK